MHYEMHYVENEIYVNAALVRLARLFVSPGVGTRIQCISQVLCLAFWFYAFWIDAMQAFPSGLSVM